MSDDEDYMSDKFVQSTESHVSSSLVYKHSEKRKLALIKKKTETELKLRERNKPIRVIEQERREEGLSSAISSTNKGSLLSTYELHTDLYIFKIKKLNSNELFYCSTTNNSLRFQVSRC